MKKVIQDQDCFVAPACDSEALRNFHNTIELPIKLESCARFLSNEEKKLLPEKVFAWGNRKGSKDDWEKLKTNDVVMFYLSEGGNKRFAAIGTVILKKYSPEISKIFWNSTDFEYTFFLKDVKYFELPLEDFNKTTGYIKTNIQNFHRVGDKYKKRILLVYRSFYGMCESFPSELARVYEEENYEKIAVPQSITNFTDEFIPEMMPEHHKKYIPQAKSKAVNRNVMSLDHDKKHRTSAAHGNWAENKVLQYEKKKFEKRKDLLKKIRKVSDNMLLGYDIESFDDNGNPKKIEVKVAHFNKDGTFSFHLSEKEKRMAELYNNYYFYLIPDEDIGEPKSPRIFPISPPFKEKEDLFSIEPKQFLVKGSLNFE